MSEPQGDFYELGRAFGRELEQLLSDAEMSVNALAQLAGINRTYLSDLIHGRRGQRGPSPAIVERIAVALEVPADSFRITRARVVLAHPTAIDVVYKRIHRDAA